METIRYARIGKEDLVLGSGTFEVTLANGQVVSLQKFDLGYFYDDVSTVANLPSTAPTGTIRRVTDGTGLLYIYDGSSWVSLATYSNTTTEGDILVADSNGTADRLAIGTARQMLLVNSGATALEYAASPQSVLTATADLLYASAANTLARLAIGSTGQILTVSSSGLPSWATSSLPQGFLSGLTMSNGTDANHDIDIATGTARNTADDGTLTLSSTMTKQIDADWATGSDAGGFPSALTLSADTTYHVFLVDDSNGDTDAGYDTSLTATNLLADTGGSSYRRIGSVVTNSSSNIIAFVQDGDVFTWDVPVNDINASNPGTSAVTATLTLPTGIRVAALIWGVINAVTTGSVVGIISDLSQTDTAPSAGGYLFNFGENSSTNVRPPSPLKIFTNTSAQLRYRVSASDTSDVVAITTYGWVDTRGRFD